MKTHFFVHILTKCFLSCRKPISCLCLSGDGEYLATGEVSLGLGWGGYIHTSNCSISSQYGHEPCARVWDLKERDPVPCSTLKAHSFGVKLVVCAWLLSFLAQDVHFSVLSSFSKAFTFGHKYLITIGYRYDRQVIVWHWKVCRNIKAICKINVPPKLCIHACL